MINYTIRRLIAAVPAVVGIMLVTFFLARAIPGKACYAALGEHATPESCRAYEALKGLDKPVYTQLYFYLRDILQGDWGTSVHYNRPVVDFLAERLPMTVELSVTAFFLAIIVGIPAGIISARYHNSFIDVGTMVGANIGVSMPVFWLGLMLAALFAVGLKGTPFFLPASNRLSAGLVAKPFFEVYGWDLVPGTVTYSLAKFLSGLYFLNSVVTLDFKTLWDAIRHMILPAAALATIPLSIIARITRSSLLEVLGLDYVRTARAKGLIQRVVILKHAFRNALLPVVTIMGLQLGGLMAGAVLTETIFGLSGMGRALFEAIQQHDYPVIQGFTIIIAIIYVTANLLVDLSYAVIDPRIRLD